MKKYLFISAFLLIVSFSFSQEYKLGIGARAGYSNGLTAKYLFYHDESKYMGVEALAGQRDGGTLFTGLWNLQKEYHIKGMRYATLYYYFGIGGHLGQYGASSTFAINNGYNKQISTIGVDGTVGLEYVFADFPISLGIDIRPYYDLINPGKNYYDLGATLRYVFKHR